MPAKFVHENERFLFSSYVKTHIYEREFIFFYGEQASRILAAYVTLYADVGSSKVQERTPTCTKAGFRFIGTRLCGL